MGTIAPEMSAKDILDPLGNTLFGKTRRAILLLLYGHPGEEFYMRQIMRLAGTGMGALQREIAALHRAGIVTRKERGRQVYFAANPDCPVYDELKNLLMKTAGVADVLREALAPLSDRIRIAFVYGSVARGEERVDSDVDVLVAGDASFSQVSGALRRAQNKLHREINPTVYSLEELRTKLANGHHFVSGLMRAEKIYLIGTERDFKRLAE